MTTIKRDTCRLCNGRLSPLFDFGNLFISTFVQYQGQDIGRAPLSLVECVSCKLIQLEHTAPQELMYSRKYWYRSGINQTIVDDLEDIVHKATTYVKGGVFLDIGANDGTLLSFVPDTFRRIAVEPATNLQEDLRQHAEIVVPTMWESTRMSGTANVITAIGMFYDSEDPNKFIENVKNYLAEDGLFIAQLMTLKPMLEKNDLGNICHEHLEFYSYENLKYLFERNGLEIFAVEENSINGGSYRIYARHYKNGSIEYPEQIDIDTFLQNIQKNKSLVTSFIRKVTKSGKKVYAYGASTKGNTILQYYGLTKNDIVGIIDINPEKIGKFAVGTDIPVVGHEEMENADYCLILPWGFKDYFIGKEKGWKGKFITHTPSFEII